MIKCHYCSKEYTDENAYCPFCAGPAPNRKVKIESPENDNLEILCSDNIKIQDNEELQDNDEEKNNIDKNGKSEVKESKKIFRNRSTTKIGEALLNINIILALFFLVICISFVCIGIYMVHDLKYINISDKIISEYIIDFKDGEFKKIFERAVPSDLLEKNSDLYDFLGDSNELNDYLNYINSFDFEIRKHGRCKINKTSIKADAINYYNERIRLFGSIDDNIKNYEDEYRDKIDDICDVISNYGIDIQNIYRVEAPIYIMINYKSFIENYNVDTSLYGEDNLPDKQSLALTDVGVYFYMYEYENEWYMIPFHPVLFDEIIQDLSIKNISK